MLNDVSHESAMRLLEVRQYLHSARLLAEPSSEVFKDAALSRTIVVMKGLFFVHLYGAYEYSVTAAVEKALTIIRSQQHLPSEFKHNLLSVILDTQFRALAAVGPSKTWQKRRELLSQLSAAIPLDIDTSVLSQTSANLAFEKLSDIWECLCVDCPIVPHPRLKYRINEVVEHRRSVAHGRETPSSVGGRFTFSELEACLNDMNEVCVHVLSSLEQYLQGKRYLI